MIKKILPLAFVFIGLASCKDNSAESKLIEQPQAETTTPEVAPQAETMTTMETAPVNAPEQLQSPNAQINQQPTTGQTAPGFSGKPNPPHGQPGHRCDIQVGQPLP